MSTSSTQRENFTHPEYHYLDLVRNMLTNGEQRPDKRRAGTTSLFATPTAPPQPEKPHTPVLSTKHVFQKVILYELFWFISGSTNNVPVSAVGAKILEGDGSRAYLDCIGLTERAQRDLGPVYGFQLRHIGAKYVDCHMGYPVQCKHHLRPHHHVRMESDRSGEDGVAAVSHVCQFYVLYKDGKGEGALCCVLYQRSCDMGLGVPFNIASSRLLTIMIAHVCGLEPGEFRDTMGDENGYADREDTLKVQLERAPRELPTAKINRQVDDIDDFKSEDFKRVGHDPHPGIKMNPAV
ncbi:unnamed protein product [Tuber melanosporum]|uniref:thymidylate synthase n=1 Tax=Tuber melanosporum (strain Mel28) TaxID=656061 RepID=D5GCZ4_TUBMM|nr:uncharacterized protein GSTUM_00006019001 [Tuber melanosporum]CAZ82387.1 unnamed protein product [Tuber melanosporum]